VVGGTLRRLIAASAALGLVASGALADCGATKAGTPRTLVLALDGVPFRLIERARARGAFSGWPEAVPLVSTFPSLTNVGFTALLQPFGVERAEGYEVQHFDFRRNAVVGASLRGYGERLFAWRHRFDVTGRTLAAKLAIYTSPRRSAWNEIAETEHALFSTESDVVLAHAGATDAWIHLRGEDVVVSFLVRLASELERIRERHRAERGRPLRIVLLSDHGNVDRKVRRVNGVHRLLRDAGLHPSRSLRGPNDVVAATFGLVSYGALFTSPDRAADAALAVVRHAQVDVATWLEGPQSAVVVSGDGFARVRWRGAGSAEDFAYEAIAADPLRLAPTVETLREEGRLDAEGFARADDWLRASVDASFPDAPRRIAKALLGSYVRNRATVIFSIKPGWAWGWSSAHVGARLNGGRLEETHGGLDRDSSLGFLLADDPELQPVTVERADRALHSVAEIAACANEAVRAGTR